MTMRRMYDKAKAAAKSFKIESLVFIPDPTRKPPDEMVHLFKSVCAALDEMAEVDPADPIASQSVLMKSKVPDQLKELCNLLIVDCNQRASFRLAGDDGGIGNEETTKALPRHSADSSQFGSTCAELFVQCHVIHELCMRAIKDQPLGTLPLVLDMLCRILVEAQYAFLPHQTIHRPIANLITFVARYDALQLRGINSSNNNNNSSINRSSRRSTSAGSNNISWRGSSQASTAVFDPLAYKERVVGGLSQLIFIIWRKITENPPVLDFFTVIDIRTVFTASKPHMRPQMDVLTTVISLMDDPSLGTRAKQVVVSVLALRDQRVDAFLAEHTTFVYSVVADLARCFLLAVDSLATDSAEESPYKLPRSYPSLLGTSAAATGGDSSKKGWASSLSPPPPRQAHSSEESAIDAFIRVLRFYEAAVAACEESLLPRQNHSEPVGRTAITAMASTTGAGTGTGTGTGMNVGEGTGASTLLSALLQVYVGVFLEGPVRTSLLLRERDGQAVAAAAVVRVALSQLLVLRRTGALTLATARYLCWQSYFGPKESVKMCDDVDTEGLVGARTRAVNGEDCTAVPPESTSTEIVETLMDQGGSASPHMSVSALLLLASVLQSAPLADVAALLRLPARPARRTYAHLDDEGSDGDERDGTGSYRGGCKKVIGGDTEAMTAAAAAASTSTSTSTPVQLGVRLSRMYEDTTRWVSHVSIDYQWAKTAAGDGHGLDERIELRKYADAAAASVLGRLTGQLSALIRPRHGCGAGAYDGGEHHPVAAAAGAAGAGPAPSYSGAALCGLLARRIAALPSLRFEQQVATSVLVNQYVCSLVALAIVRGRWPQAAATAPVTAVSAGSTPVPDPHPHPDPVMFPEYAAVQEVLRAVHALWEAPGGLQVQLTRVQDCDRKLVLMRDALAAPVLGTATRTGTGTVDVDTLSRESASARRCLETGVVVREMALELKAVILAGRRLRADVGHVFLFASEVSRQTLLPRRRGRGRGTSPCPRADVSSLSPEPLQSETVAKGGKEAEDGEVKTSPGFTDMADCIDRDSDHEEGDSDSDSDNDNEDGLFAMPATLTQLETLTHRAGTPASARHGDDGRGDATAVAASSSSPAGTGSLSAVASTSSPSTSDVLAAAVALGVIAFAAYRCLPAIATGGVPLSGLGVGDRRPSVGVEAQGGGATKDGGGVCVQTSWCIDMDVDIDTSADVDSDSEDDHFRSQWAAVALASAGTGAGAGAGAGAVVGAVVGAGAGAVVGAGAGAGTEGVATPAKGDDQHPRHPVAATAPPLHSPPHPPPSLVLFSPASAAYAALARLATPQPCHDQRAEVFLRDYAAARRGLAGILGEDGGEGEGDCDFDEQRGRDTNGDSDSDSVCVGDSNRELMGDDNDL